MADCWQPQPSWTGSHWYQGQPSLRSSTFRNLVSAFPRPRQTGRVTKPRSAGNSPTHTGRRRTTVSNSSPMYRHLPTQNYQAPYDPALLAAAFHRNTATRPISWHPASLGTATYPENFPTTAHNDMEVMGMASQPLDVSPPVMTNANMLQPYALPNVPMSTDACFPGMQYTTSIQQPSLMGMSDPVAWDTNEAHTSSINQPMSDNWAFDMMSMNNSMPSADVAGSGYASAPSSGCLSGPSTPDFLPIQQPDDNSLPLSVATVPKPKAEEELVGMGLYNHPDSLFETFEGLSGKGLKLEETFTPSAENEADDTKDAENEDDDELDIGKEQVSVHIPPSDSKLYHPVKSAGNMMHKSFFFDDDDFDQQAVPGSQQIFNLGQPCMNYGYGWI
ncbi:hypothetical protein P170DRAFT_440650 [Aspergillus steynii IBT 23096]|uniref:Uncharacterized protein n=1 Tax=Aspergillus steynii IBT 23096 TaxID=1392250 RepID=A0A2I2FUQ0_9EURO|nr:uncharacterized protein P170DRAFT_440650 [Aspergillus steynii IBT 23096]PLB44352.1 hypothetical protein P170DRAFT_440650 [Aspergillus steynii IBT 23096]